MSKQHSFHYPETDGVHFARAMSTAWADRVLWAAVQMERARRSTPAVVRLQNDERSEQVIETDWDCHRPCVAAGAGQAALAWNETDGQRWRLVSARSADGFESRQTVAESDDLILPPAAAFDGEALWLAWAERIAGRMRICVAHDADRRWRVLDPVSPADVDAFRPALAAGGGRVTLAWDQYRNGTYEVGVSSGDASGWSAAATAGQPDERWFCPRVAAARDGRAFLTWVVMKEVVDPKLGIVDHFPFGMVGVLEQGELRFLEDAANTLDPRIVADCREGLLASETYQGSHGLRRNPHVTLDAAGRLWCAWEVRIEAEKTNVKCHLAARRLTDDGAWTEPRFVHRNRYAWSVAAHAPADRLAVSYIRHEQEGLAVVGAELLGATGGDPLRIDHAAWARWTPAVPRVPAKPKEPVEVGGKTYRLFWADTHCHSNVCADAEGEPDELIHFGRDLAGLDAICVVDNDFYPHKALTVPEWRVHQALARHFTVEGQFVALPGWEYTFHRQDLKPDFNHRVVMYARDGELFRRIDSNADRDAKLVDCLKGTGALSYPHHCSWDQLDPDLECNVEICSSWRVCFEEERFARDQLAAGKRFGFIGSSDTHRSVPGLGGALTGLWAEDLTPEALFDAYRQRRLVATQGQFVHITFSAGGAFLGGEATCDGSPEIEAHVRAPEAIEFVEVVRDSEPIHRQTPGADACRLAFTDDDASAGAHCYYLRVKLAGDPSFNSAPAESDVVAFSKRGRYPHNLCRARGPFAWASPVWLDVQR